jgi:hypothetical protein
MEDWIAMIIASLWFLGLIALAVKMIRGERGTS